jgi:hypothetical protein
MAAAGMIGEQMSEQTACENIMLQHVVQYWFRMSVIHARAIKATMLIIIGPCVL